MIETLATIIVLVWIIRKVSAWDALKLSQAVSRTPPLNPVPGLPKAPALAWVFIGGVRYVTYVHADGTRVLVKA